MIVRTLRIVPLLILIAPLAVRACTCSQAPPGKCPGLQPGDVVFLGTVTEIESLRAAPVSSSAVSSDPPGAPAPAPADANVASVTRYHFRVDERFAGADSPEEDIFSGGEDADCGYRFKSAGQYLVFTHRGSDGRLYSTICSGTRPARDARALIPQLRAMRDGQRVASVFGVLRRTDPPFLSAPDDPAAPLGSISLHLRSRYDRFETSTDANGVYSFYDVHAGVYTFAAKLPSRMELTQRTLTGGLPPFKIPAGACYEYDVDALPTGHIRGSVLGPGGKPLAIASLELHRAGTYSDSRPGLWSFQGAKGIFDFDHIGPGKYILVYNRPNFIDPNSPFARTFYPGVTDLAEAKPIVLKEGQQLLNLKMKVSEGFPTRQIRVRLRWQGARPAGRVIVTAHADQGDNPAARQIARGLYEFTLLESANYTFSASEELSPRARRAASWDGSLRRGPPPCALPPRIDAAPVTVAGSDASVKEISLIFARPDCSQTAP